MRRAEAPPLSEREQILSTVSPRTVSDHWSAQFRAGSARILSGLASGAAPPLRFERLARLRFYGHPGFSGGAFRGPFSMPVAWRA